ncbi:hypothetical protein LINGRAHAP2_LOCUS17988 [Linum grandiflorum]
MKDNAWDFSTTTYATVVVAAALLFNTLTHQSAAQTSTGVCKSVTHRQLCDALVKGSPDALSATVAVAEKLIQMTNRAKSQLEATPGAKTDSTLACIQNYNLAVQDISLGLAHVERDKYTFTSKVSSAISYYGQCNSGGKSSTSQLSERLSNAASTCLEIAQKIPS